MNLPPYILSFLRIIYFFILQISTIINNTINPKLPEVQISEEEQFNQTIKSRFLELLENDSLDHSKNIDPIFYYNKNFIEYMKTPNTEQEKIWKTRIQLITTPRGNIIMYYDSYKLGFSYYCDHNVVPYDILNCCAMKYVMNFNCVNFFIDEYILPENSENPLKIHYLDEPKKKDEQTKINMNQSNLSPFMKPKQSQTKNVTQESIKLRNKFIYLGNIRNFSPLKREKKTVEGFVSILLDGTDNQLSWSNYKNIIKNN